MGEVRPLLILLYTFVLKGGIPHYSIWGDLCTTLFGKGKMDSFFRHLHSSSSSSPHPHFRSCPPPQPPSLLGLGVCAHLSQGERGGGGEGERGFSSTSFFVRNTREYLITAYGVTSVQHKTAKKNHSSAFLLPLLPIRTFLLSTPPPLPRAGRRPKCRKERGGRGRGKGESSFLHLRPPVHRRSLPPPWTGFVCPFVTRREGRRGGRGRGISSVLPYF